MTKEELEEAFKLLMEDLKKRKEEPIGDGEGVFLPEMTDEEYEEWVMKEEKGWKGFINKIFNLSNKDEADNE